jgi:hypothetical protein
MVLSDMKPLCKKSYGVAVVLMDEDFGVVLYHVDIESNGCHYPTLTLFCEDPECGKKYCTAGIADYFTIMFDMRNKNFRTTYRVHKFDDCCGDIDQYRPWSFELFRSSNAPFIKGSHMMTMKLTLSFVSSLFVENDKLNTLNDSVEGWRQCDYTKNPGVALRFHMSKIGYDMMIQAIEEKLYKPVRDEVGHWCGHLDPLDTCQTVAIMVQHFVDNHKGKPGVSNCE